jgi:hypothetical protein
MELYDLISWGCFETLTEILLRGFVVAVGVAVFGHFASMAAAMHGPDVPLLDALLIAAIGASGVGVSYSALFSCMQHLLAVLGLMGGLMIVFFLRLWGLGFHVSAFYKERTK